MRLFRFFFAIALLLSSLAVVSCEKPAPQPVEQPTIEVNYDVIAGWWQLSHWQGKELSENTHLYIEFDIDQRYTMWDNIDSMYSRMTTGSYTISEEADGSYTISGTYDNGVGKWSDSHRVTLTGDSTHMQWRSRKGNQTMDFIYVGELPELN